MRRDVVDAGVAPGNHQYDRGQNQIRRQRVGQDVPFDVVDTDQRQIRRQGQGLARGKAHQQRSDQTGASGHGHPVQVFQFKFLPFEKVVHQRQQIDQMSAAGQFGDHAAEAIVQVHLGGHQILRHAVIAVVQGHTRVVAGRFDAKNFHDPASGFTGQIFSRNPAVLLAICSISSKTGPTAAAISRTSTLRLLRPRAATVPARPSK